jgi:hypothetical protein
MSMLFLNNWRVSSHRVSYDTNLQLFKNITDTEAKIEPPLFECVFRIQAQPFSYSKTALTLERSSDWTSTLWVWVQNTGKIGLPVWVWCLRDVWWEGFHIHKQMQWSRSILSVLFYYLKRHWRVLKTMQNTLTVNIFMASYFHGQFG